MSALPDWLKVSRTTQIIEGPSAIEPHRVRIRMKSYAYAQPGFVTFLLDRVFKRSAEDIGHIALRIHSRKDAVVGIYTQDIAQRKAFVANEYIKRNHEPLKITLENE